MYVNINWKDKPTNFNDYYKGYLLRGSFHTCEDPEHDIHKVFGLNECDFQINLAPVTERRLDKGKKATLHRIRF